MSQERCPQCGSHLVDRDGEPVFDEAGEYLGYAKWHTCADCGNQWNLAAEAATASPGSGPPAA